MTYGVLVWLGVVVGVAMGVNPGAGVYAGMSGLNKAMKAYLPKLVAEAKSTTIPGGSSSHFNYDSFKFSQFDISSVPIKLTAPNKVDLTLENIVIGIPHVHFEVKDKLGPIHVHCSGELWASVTGTNIGLGLTVVDQGGHPFIPAIAPTVHFGSVKFDHKFDHTLCKIADKIASIFVDINKKVEEAVEKQIPGLISSKLKDTANKALEQLTMTVDIGKDAKLDYNLTGNPVISPSFAYVPVRGEFLWTKGKTPAMPPPPALPARTITRDAVIEVSDSVLDSACAVFTAAGDLDVNKRLPPNPWNTTIFKILLPAIYKACPSCPIQVAYGIVKGAPVFTIKPGDAFAQVDASVLDVYVVRPNNTLWNVFNLGVNATAAVNFTITTDPASHRQVLHPDLQLLHFDFDVIKSPVGPFDPKPLSNFVQYVLQHVVVPEFNAKFKGVPIPSVDGVTLANTHIDLEAHAVVAASDLSFHPTTDTRA